MININYGDVIGQIIAGFISSTGSLIMALIIILLIALSACIMFGIPIEISALIVFPFTLACMSITGDIITFGLILIIYITTIITKNFIFR